MDGPTAINDAILCACSMNSDPVYVYILLCANNSLYVGVTDDVEARLELHNQAEAHAIQPLIDLCPSFIEKAHSTLTKG
jgi:hypothetical protein